MWRPLSRSKRPFLAQKAAVGAPPIELTLLDRAALEHVKRSGAAGVRIGDGISLSLAIRLGVLGLVAIDRDRQLVRAASSGGANV